MLDTCLCSAKSVCRGRAHCWQPCRFATSIQLKLLVRFLYASCIKMMKSPCMTGKAAADMHVSFWFVSVKFAVSLSVTKFCACMLQDSSPLSLQHLTCTSPAWSLSHLQASAESTAGQNPADDDAPTTSAVSCDTALQPNGSASLFFYLHPSPSRNQASG